MHPPSIQIQQDERIKPFDIDVSNFDYRHLDLAENKKADPFPC